MWEQQTSALAVGKTGWRLGAVLGLGEVSGHQGQSSTIKAGEEALKAP